MKNDTPAPIRRHLNLKVSPNEETLGEIRRIVSDLDNPEAVVVVTGPWDGAVIAELKGIKGALVAVDDTPSAELVKAAKKAGAQIEDAIPEGTTVLIIDSALHGMAQRDAEAAIRLGVPNILIHNTSLQLANVPKPLHSAIEGVRSLVAKGYSQATFQSESIEGGRRGLTFLSNSEVPEVAEKEEASDDTDPDTTGTGDTTEDTDTTGTGDTDSPATGDTPEGTDTGDTTDTRAREPDGTFSSDDPATPELNEAFDPPKKVAKKAAKKVAKEPKAKKATKEPKTKKAAKKAAE